MKRSKKGEAITEWEYNILKNNNQCPNCLVGEVQEGPSGGISTNYRCRCCGQGYNLTLFEQIENIGIDESWIDIRYQRKLKLENLDEK